MKYALRGKFGKYGEVVAEFWPAAKRSERVIIYCMGLPTNPFKFKLIESFAKRGYSTFVPRYRGTWESGGKFLQVSPAEDIREVIDGIIRGFESSGPKTRTRIEKPEINLIANSFGGPCGFLLSRDPRIRKVVAISPVTDWRKDSKFEPIKDLQKLTNDWFGQAYRGNPKALIKLKRGKFYNPAENLELIDGGKIMVLHAKDDLILPWRPVAQFAKKIGAQVKIYARGGHFGASDIVRPPIMKTILKFFK